LGEVLDEGQALINLNTPFYYWNIAVQVYYRIIKRSRFRTFFNYATTGALTPVGP
jgi:hypothetical protein